MLKSKVKITEDQYKKVSEILENKDFSSFWPDNFKSSLLKKGQNIHEVSPIFWQIYSNDNFVRAINFFNKNAKEEIINEKIKKMTSDNEEQNIISIVSELEIYYLLASKDITINFIKENKGNKNADFIIEKDEYNIYLEVFTVQLSKNEISFINNQMELQEMLDGIENNPYCITYKFMASINKDQLNQICFFVKNEILKAKKNKKKSFSKTYKEGKTNIINFNFTLVENKNETGFVGGYFTSFQHKSSNNNKIIGKIIDKINHWQFPKRNGDKNYFGFLIVIESRYLNFEYDVPDAFLGKRNGNKYNGLLDMDCFNNSDLDFLVLTNYKKLLDKNSTFLYVPSKNKKEDIFEKIFLES